MNIDLDRFERKTDCGTYRCVAGWWWHFLGEKIYRGDNQTKGFEAIYRRCGFMSCFLNKYDVEWWAIFGSEKRGNLQARLTRVDKLIEKIK